MAEEKEKRMYTKSKFAIWQIVVAIVLFPIGLLALLAGRKTKTYYK